MNVPAGNHESLFLEKVRSALDGSSGGNSDVMLNLRSPAHVLDTIRELRGKQPDYDIARSAVFPKTREKWQELLLLLSTLCKVADDESSKLKKLLDDAGRRVSKAKRQLNSAQQQQRSALNRYNAVYDAVLQSQKQRLSQQKVLDKERKRVAPTVEIYDKQQDDYTKEIHRYDRLYNLEKNPVKKKEHKQNRIAVVQKRRIEYARLKAPRELYRQISKAIKDGNRKVRRAAEKVNKKAKNLSDAENLLNEAIKERRDYQEKIDRFSTLSKAWRDLLEEIEELYAVWSEWNVTSDSTHAVSPSVIDQYDNVTAPVDSDSVAAIATGGHSSSNACTVSETPVERILDRSETIV
jgi:hypothetical protein